MMDGQGTHSLEDIKRIRKELKALEKSNRLNPDVGQGRPDTNRGKSVDTVALNMEKPAKRKPGRPKGKGKKKSKEGGT